MTRKSKANTAKSDEVSEDQNRIRRERDAKTEYPRALTAWVTKIARVDFSRSLYHF
jgi:hypothetical protein